MLSPDGGWGAKQEPADWAGIFVAQCSLFYALQRKGPLPLRQQLALEQMLCTLVVLTPVRDLLVLH